MAAPVHQIDETALRRIHDQVHTRLFGHGGAAAKPELGERYRVLDRLGQGAASIVWEVEHTGTGRRLAAKVLTLDHSFGGTARERLLLEARAVGRLSHPNVVEVIDVGTTPDDRPFLVMERLRGRTLERILADDGPLPWDRAATFLRQLAAGLAAAHDIGLVHRDLKPANIMLIDEGTEHERCKVLDFGLARWRQLDEAASRLTRSGVLFGTPSYMSPEQIKRGEVDARSDVYALGCLAWELVRGRPPFVGESIAEILYQQIFEHPASPFEAAPPSRATRSADAWIRKCMRKRPQLRFVDMTAAIAGLDAAKRGELPVVVPDEQPLVSTPTYGRARWVALGLVAVIATAIASPFALGRARGPSILGGGFRGVAREAFMPTDLSPPRGPVPSIEEGPRVTAPDPQPVTMTTTTTPEPRPQKHRRGPSRAAEKRVLPSRPLVSAPPPNHAATLMNEPAAADARPNDWADPFERSPARAQKRAVQPPAP